VRTTGLPPSPSPDLRVLELGAGSEPLLQRFFEDKSMANLHSLRRHTRKFMARCPLAGRTRRSGSSATPTPRARWWQWPISSLIFSQLCLAYQHLHRRHVQARQRRCSGPLQQTRVLGSRQWRAMASPGCRTRAHPSGAILGTARLYANALAFGRQHGQAHKHIARHVQAACRGHSCRVSSCYGWLRQPAQAAELKR
jgi:hypothetical protein